MAFSSANDVAMTNCGSGSASSSNSLAKANGFTERNKKWQMDLLMERLRSKSAQYKPLQDTSRNIRISMLEKRYALDIVEKSNLQKCLDRMQYCIKVTTRQGLVERLESLSRQLGLKFSDDNLNLFISSDMFYLEIILDSSGKVHDVKVHHEFKSDQQSCQELVSCLLKGDFADFTAQLEGLTSIYQLNADKKTKSNAFVALQALESDLQTLYSLYVNNKDPYVLVQSSVGILQPRRGGHPMRLTYFVSPYQLIDIESNSLRPLTVELVHAQSTIGLSVTVHLEAASSNKLQVQPTVKVQEDAQGNRTPDYKPISADNSIMLPAYFVLRLNKPIVIAVNLLRQIEQITRTKFPEEILSKASPILSLIASHGSDGQIQNTSKGLFVSLPDQTHCYFLTENYDLPCVVIKSIPFTEPSHVPKILQFLRQQSLFNTLITSCIRTSNYKPDIENATMFEIIVLSYQHISIALEHPYMETMATVELDLTTMPNIKCNIFTLGGNYNNITSSLSRVLQTCASIPITVRMLIKYWEREHMNKIRGLDSSNLSLFYNQGGNLSANNANKAAYSDLENGTIKNGDVSKHGEFGCSDTQSQQRSSGDDPSSESGDGKASKRRRSEDFDYFRRNDIASKDNSKADMFARVQRIDIVSKDANNQSSDGQLKSSSQRMTGDMLKDTFRSSDDLKSIKMSKTNVDCDKVKVNKSDSYDPNGKRIDSSSLCEPLKKKIKRPREEKSSDGSSSLSSSVSITPIASMQLQTSLSSTGQSTTASSSTSSNLSSVLTTSAQNLTPDHWPQPQHQQQQSMHRLERTPGIELIPIPSQPTQNLKSSITITPINSTSKNSSSAGASNEKRTGANNGNEHSSSKRSSDSFSSSDSSRLRLEKKKKRKREDSPMGPPEKMPVTVSIKTSDGSPISPSGQQMLRKFNSSPVLQQSSKSGLSTASNKISPKHSPHSGSSSHSSPKHQNLPSPKGNHYSTSPPKHSSSSGSGKPSMLTLKSATSSPNSKSSISSSGERIKTYSSSSSRDRQDRERDRDRDRERYKYSSGSNSPKLKAKIPSAFIQIDSLMDASSSSQDSIKSSGSSQANKNQRKNSLNAVIDKLSKTARHVNDESPPNTPTLPTPSQSIGADANSVSSASIGQTVSKEKVTPANTQSLNLPNVSPISIASVKNNSEYMVKHSSDVMKITINKTRTKDTTSPSSKQNYQHSSSSSSSSSGSGSNSPKTHTGLKPGVNSGPASKKPHASLQSSQSESTKDSNGSQKRPMILDTTNTSNQMSSSNNTAFNSSSSSSSKSIISKSNSGSLNSSSASQSKTSSAPNSSQPKSSINSMDSYKKDKNRFTNKSGTGNGRDVMKMLGMNAQSLDVFGVKTWNANYQIPKLSARSNAADKDTLTTNTSTVTASSLSSSQETNSNKPMVNFMSNVHSFGGNQMHSNKIHGGRASSVSPKYNVNTEGTSNFNKDIHIYKSSSSDALQHQSQSSGHHIQLPSGNNAFASLLPNKSPLHHSSSMNVTSKSMVSGTPHLSGSSKNSPTNTGTNIMGTASSAPSPKDLVNFQDQMKKNRPPSSKPIDNFAGNAANSIMNPNQMRNMQSSGALLNQSSQSAPLRRPSPQQTFSKELFNDNKGSVFWA